MSANIRVEKNGYVTTIIIQRPELRNAVDRPTAEALAQSFRDFEDDATSRVAVLYGEGGFCSGADLVAVAESPERANRLAPEGDGPMGPSRMLLSKPVIAAISGHAVAGGIELAAWCDLRVMEQDAIMGVFCRRFGVPLIDGGTVRLPRLIGMSRALDLILTGRPVGAEEALNIGLANRVVEPGRARQAAEELAKQIADFPQGCMLSDRASVYEQWDKTLDEALGNEFARGMQVVESGETVAGATSFKDGKGRHGHFS